MLKTLLTLLMVIMFTASARAEDFPKGYPFSFWGDAYSGTERNVITGRFEQGVELNTYKDWSLLPYVAIGASKGSRSERYWENEYIPEVGVKIIHPVHLTNNGWGSVSLGLRQRWEDYFDSVQSNLSTAQVFIQLSFGGDWKSH